MSNYISNKAESIAAGYGVWHAINKEYIYDWILIADEERVRIDVFDKISNYRVVEFKRANEGSEELLPVLLEGWEINYT